MSITRRGWPGARNARRGGFTLVELAVVLVILGVLTRAAIAPLGELLERRRTESTRQRLEAVRHALIGHLVTHGVLPCPLDGRGVGGEAMSGAGAGAAPCRLGEGRVPGAKLGVAGALGPDGGLLDAWGRPLRYAVSLAAVDGDASVWTTPGAARAAGLGALTADLVLCASAAREACPHLALRASAVAFVVLSTGRDPSARDAQAENLDGDRVHALAPFSTVDGHRFDDLLVWGTRNELAYWLLRAEWLP